MTAFNLLDILLNLLTLIHALSKVMFILTISCGNGNNQYKFCIT